MKAYNYEDTKALMERMANGEDIDLDAEFAKLTPVATVTITEFDEMMEG